MDSKQETLFFEIHQDNPREGPGNFKSTKKAFSMLNDLPERPGNTGCRSTGNGNVSQIC
jgi:hypothetical protein